MIWAFNPRSNLNYRNQYFTYHDEHHRGRLSVVLSEGRMVALPVKAFNYKLIHGAGMAFVWILLFPLSIFYARYLRSTFRWIVVHITIQTTGSILMICMMAVILWTTVTIEYRISHVILGLTILSMVAAQIVLGVFNALGMMLERFFHVRKWIQKFHYFVGASLLVMAAVQVGLGIDILYPWVEPRVPAVWVVYFCFVVDWVGAFVFAEVYSRMKLKRRDVGVFLAHDEIAASLKSRGALEKKKKDGEVVAVGGGEPSDTLLAPDGRRFTWQSLDQAVLDG